MTRSAGIIGGVIVAVVVIGAVRCAKAEELPLCAPVEEVYFAAKVNAKISDVRLITRKAVPAIEQIIPEAIDPAMTPSTGLLIVWLDRKAILFVAFNQIVCGRGIDVLYDEVPRLQAALSEREQRAAFKLHPKVKPKIAQRAKQPRRRMPTRHAATPAAPSYARGLE